VHVYEGETLERKGDGETVADTRRHAEKVSPMQKRGEKRAEALSGR